jgi:hypothetical protein
MRQSDSLKHIPRRTFLAGVGAAAGAGAFLRPLFASAAGASPMRLVVIHRPCGTYEQGFFPAAGTTTNFALSQILMPLQAVQSEMVILNGITCPRDPGWPGDKHAAGLISLMSGSRAIEIPGTNSGGDPNAKNQCAPSPSFDQWMLQKSTALQGTSTPSLQSTAYRPSSIGLPNFKVMSYTGVNGALFPEARPDVLFSNLFQSSMANLPPDVLAKLKAQKMGVLDFIHKDLTRLQGTVPSSQKAKLDAHLAGIQALETKLNAPVAMAAAGTSCAAPPQAALPAPTADLTIDEAQHTAVSQNQLGIIASAFQCDLTRVATFTFAHGNSALRFSKIIPNFTNTGGHHDISHQGDQHQFHAMADQYYATRVAEFIQLLKNTPDGAGTLLDNTIVVYLNEVNVGAVHSIENIPLLMFGGKNLGLQRGQFLHFGGRYMNDVWAAVATAMGVPSTTWGDTAFSKGPVPGLFA